MRAATQATNHGAPTAILEARAEAALNLHYSIEVPCTCACTSAAAPRICRLGGPRPCGPRTDRARRTPAALRRFVRRRPALRLRDAYRLYRAAQHGRAVDFVSTCETAGGICVLRFWILAWRVSRGRACGMAARSWAFVSGRIRSACLRAGMG